MGNQNLDMESRHGGLMSFAELTGAFCTLAFQRPSLLSVPETLTRLSDGINEYRLILPASIDPQSDDLLTVLRDDVLCPTIPAGDGEDQPVDSIDLFRSRLNGEEEGVALIAIVAGTNLSNSFKRTVKGGCMAELYTNLDTNETHAHLTYLASLKEGEGIGSFLIRYRIALAEALSNLKTLFIEVCNDNSRSRDIFLSLGAKIGPSGFCRPENATHINHDYTQMFYPCQGRLPSLEDIEDARLSYWRVQGVKNPLAHPDFQEMSRQAQSWPGFTVQEDPKFESRMQAFRTKYGFGPPGQAHIREPALAPLPVMN